MKSKMKLSRQGDTGPLGETHCTTQTLLKGLVLIKGAQRKRDFPVIGICNHPALHYAVETSPESRVLPHCWDRTSHTQTHTHLCKDSLYTI